DPVVEAAGRVQGALASWVDRLGPLPLLLVLVLLLGGTVLASRTRVLSRSRRRAGEGRAGRPAPSGTGTGPGTSPPRAHLTAHPRHVENRGGEAVRALKETLYGVVEPPFGEVERGTDAGGGGVDLVLRREHRIDVPGCPAFVIGQRDGCSTNHIEVSD